MFEDKYIYVVHSDTDENNIYAEFEDEAEALEYAKAHVEEQTYVERVYCEADVESGEIVDVYETEVIWDYASAEDLDEFLDAKVNVDFDGGDNNDVRVLSSFDPEVEGEPLDELLDADINLSIDGGTGNNVGVLSPGLNLTELLDADIDLNLDGGTGNDVSVLSKGLTEGLSGQEFDEFTKLCKEIGILDLGDLQNFLKEVNLELGCPAKDVLQALRDYRAELGPDFKIVEAVEEPKWNIGSDKLVSRFSQEYKNLEKLADMLEAQAGPNETYVVDRTYEDYGAGMEWYTIIHICDLEKDDSYQLLSPKQWIYLANTGDVEGVYENIINKKPLKEEAVTLVAPEAEEDEDLDAAIQSRFTTSDLTKDEEIKADPKVLEENIDKMLEELEEHEDEVECQSCFELVNKACCTKNEKGHYICERCSHPREELDEDLDFEKILNESQSQEISKVYSSLSKDFGIDLEDLVWGENGFMMTKYPEGFPDFSGDVIYSEKYWEELVKFAESKGISLATDVYAEELDEHIQDRPEPIETEQELKGTDNAIVDCKVADVVAHCEDEKPVDCEGEEKPLEKPLAEETHAQFAKPEGNRVQAYNNALKYAKKENKPFIYGYTNHTGKFFAAEIPMKVTGSPADAEKEFRSKYKNSKVVYIAYPNKTFIKEEAELEN